MPGIDETGARASAIDPTDTIPLTSRAKILMDFPATAALITSLLVIARAVGATDGGRRPLIVPAVTSIE